MKKSPVLTLALGLLLAGHAQAQEPKQDPKPAAVLVASVRLHCLETVFHPRYQGPNEIPCDAGYRKGDELGWFQHGSFILVFAPSGFTITEGIHEGTEIRMGQRLMVLPVSQASR